MNRALRALLSIILIAAGIFGLLTGIVGVKETLSIRKDKTEDFESARDAITSELLPGIIQLRESEAQLSVGKDELSANTDAYNRSKELQDTLNTVNGLVTQYEATKEAIVNGTSDLLNNNSLDPLDLGGTGYDNAMRTAERIFLSGVRSVLSTDLITNTLGMSIDIPDDADDFPNWFQGFAADANAKLQTYEDAQRQIAAGEAQLAQGYADYAAAQQLLADGKKQLTEFEEGSVTLAVGLARLMTQPAYQNNYVGQVFPDESEVPGKLFDTMYNNIEESDRDTVIASVLPGFWDTENANDMAFPKNQGEGDEVCPSMLTILRKDEYLGSSFDPAADIYRKENGGIMVRNGYPVVDLDVAETIVNAGLDYINEFQEPAFRKETTGKLITYALMLLGSAAGLLGGLFGLLALFGKCTGAAKAFGGISAIAAVGGLIATLVTGGFKGYAFGLSDGAIWPWGHIIEDIPGKEQLPALLILAAAALLFFLFCRFAKESGKAAEPTAQPVSAAPERAAGQETVAAGAPQALKGPYLCELVPRGDPPVSAAQTAADRAAAAAARAQAAAASGDAAAAQKAAEEARQAAKEAARLAAGE